ncbi:MAG: PAS domain-containing protein [Burkholderiaceae bacterium]|nr:PAS domain-containing protein [Burkholderiaceae bacterium]
MSEPAPIWHEAPCPALELWLDAGQPRWQLNRAGVEWALDAHRLDADWQALAQDWLAQQPAPIEGQLALGTLSLRYRAVAVPPRWLLWLQPGMASAPALREGWPEAADKLALMQGFGRIGFVERDARTGRGWWDKNMFRMVGLEPALQPPSFEEALQRVHPDDRESLRRHHLQALQRAGRYETRYRLLLPDGRQRDVQALAEVRNGADGRPATMLGVIIDDTESAALVRAQQAVSAQLAQALELAKISVWRIDLREQRIDMNDTGFGFTGLEPSAEGLRLAEIRELAHPDDRAAVIRAAEQAVATEGVVDVETRYLHADGRYRHLLTRRVAVRDEQGQAIALTGVSLDQTERIAERERAQGLARRIQLVAEAAGVGVWSIENPGEGEAERVEWNAQMFRIYGLPESQPAPPLREWMGERVHEDDRARVAEERRRARRAGSAGFETSFRIVQPDGALRWVVCRSQRDQRDGRTVLHGIHVDVTQQRALDQALRLQEQRLQLATQIAGVGIWERDLATGTVIWEEQMYRLRGLQSDDLRTPREIDEQIMLPQALAERRQRIQRHLEDSEPYAYEFEVRWPDGSMRWLASTGSAVRDDSGRAVRMVGLNWDVTQRRRAEAALRDVEAAERASRAKSEFLARMSHELRTPLNAMLGFAQLLAHEAADRLDPPQLERLSRIRSAGTHLLSLIDEVLDLSAVEAGALPVALQPISLDEAVDEVRQWLAPMAAEQQLTLRVAASGGWVLADTRRLRQVLANLVSNAIKYNRPGGQVRLDLRRLVVDGTPGWELAVRDTGRGLSAEQQAHLYEPFNRLGAEREGIEGRGIGLMTVHHLVRLMGGRLQQQSRVGEGSEFRVWLPAAPQAGALAAPADAGEGEAGEGEAAHERALSVLYVEDNPVNVMLVRELVGLRPNVTLQVAADGRSGIEQALQQRPELVLVDMQLPDMQGHELLRRLRARQLPSHIIALSANAMPDAVQRARDAGFDDYWTKPIDIAQFLAGLDRLAAAQRTLQTRSTQLSSDKE